MSRPPIVIPNLTTLQKDELLLHQENLIRSILTGVMKMYEGLDWDELPIEVIVYLDEFMVELKDAVDLSNSNSDIIVACKYHRVSDTSH